MSRGYSDFGEDHIARGLSAKGWFILPYGKMGKGHAPLAQSCDEAIILPDLQIMAQGKNRWVEVKRKTRPAFMRSERCFKHGFCKRQWDHYRKFEVEAGVETWIFIWEVENRAILYAPISYLKHPQVRKATPFKEKSSNNRTDFCTHGMVFFRRDDFWVMNESEFLSGTWNDTWLLTR